MEIIPLIRMEKRKILDDALSDNVLEQIDEEQIIYILDMDGIEKDKPNLCTYQRLSKSTIFGLITDHVTSEMLSMPLWQALAI